MWALALPIGLVAAASRDRTCRHAFPCGPRHRGAGIGGADGADGTAGTDSTAARRAGGAAGPPGPDPIPGRRCRCRRPRAGAWRPSGAEPSSWTSAPVPGTWSWSRPAYALPAIRSGISRGKAWSPWRPSPDRSFRGRVRGKPASSVRIAFQDGRINGFVDPGEGDRYFVEPLEHLRKDAVPGGVGKGPGTSCTAKGTSCRTAACPAGWTAPGGRRPWRPCRRGSRSIGETAIQAPPSGSRWGLRMGSGRGLRGACPREAGGGGRTLRPGGTGRGGAVFHGEGARQRRRRGEAHQRHLQHGGRPVPGSAASTSMCASRKSSSRPRTSRPGAPRWTSTGT